MFDIDCREVGSLLFSDVLGDDQDRYLARWYRMAEYEIREPTSARSANGVTLLARGRVTYPRTICIVRNKAVPLVTRRPT